jgi:hypothetical protein
LPELRDIIPLLPLLASPVAIVIDPPSPTLDVPVLNTTSPLTPDLPELDVANNNDPLELDVEYPDFTSIWPPERSDDVPADITTDPPDPLFPDPTVRDSMPPAPDLADPDPKYSDPESPELDVPVLRTNSPLTPEDPAFVDIISIFPLVDAMLYPDSILTLPPVAADDIPAVMDIFPSSTATTAANTQ